MVTTTMDVQEYAKQKGIPVGSIPSGAFRKAQSQDFSIRQSKVGGKAEAFKTLCFDTKDLVEKCVTSKKVSAWERERERRGEMQW